MSLDVTLTFNSYNLKPLLSAYAVNYETATRKTVTALGGTEYSGKSTSRPVITFRLLPLTDAQSKAVYDALKIMVASCSYTDPATNASRTAQFRVVSNLDYAFALRSVDSNRYYKGAEITLRGVKTIA